MLRDEILEAARALIAKKGYATMSMEELAAQVGVSKPTLYSHFANKDDLVVAAATSLLERITERFEASFGERTPLQQLAFLLHMTIQMQVEMGALTVSMDMPEVFHLLHDRPEAFACVRRLDELVVGLFRAAYEQGEIDPQFDLPTVVRAYHALAKALHTAAMSQSGPPNPDTVADQITQIFLRAVEKR